MACCVRAIIVIYFARRIGVDVLPVDCYRERTTLLTAYGYIAIFLIISVLFGAIAILSSTLIRAKRANPVKLSTYECGLEPFGPAWIQFKVGFYLYALVFVIFDVETVFLYPWAVAYKQLGLFALVEMFIFVGLLVVGLLYAWRKRALVWQ